MAKQAGPKTRSNKRKREAEEQAMTAKPFSPLTSSPRSLTQEIARVYETLTPLHEEGGSHAALDTAHQAIVKLSDICSSSDAVLGWMLENSERACMLLTWLDLRWYPADTDDALRMRDSCITCVCQLVALLACQADFRQPQHRKTQQMTLCKLVSILENAPSSEQAVSRTSSHLHVILRNACEAITAVLRDQKEAKQIIQERGGIPLLVRLLHSVDSKVQRASTAVLRTLAFKEDSAKSAIVAADAVPPLIRMLRSEDHATHYEAVGTLGNLVHSSPDIKKRVLDAGILQPVINLLQCTCRESLREAALLVGQFAQCDTRGPQQVRRGARETEDYRVKIVQRGAVPPLIAMLKQTDRALREMAAFALGRLAQNADNQAGIFAMGVLQPLLDLLNSGVKNLEHNAAFTLYGLADNPDNVPEIVKRGGFERLRTADFIDDQPTKDCIDKTIRRIKERVQNTEFIKEHLKQLLMSRNTEMKHRMALCLAHLLDGDDLATAYSTYGGASVLVDLVCDAHGAIKRGEEWRSALEALAPVVQVTQEREKDSLHHIEPCVPDEKVYLGKSYVNSPKQHDVVFVVDGKPFYAHKLALCASSEAFSAMFESGCKEGSGVPTIDIPHIRRPVFEAMITFLYTGTMDECQDTAVIPDLLEAADQYLLTPLTKAVAERLAAKLDVDNVVDYYELAMQYNAKQLAYAASSFMVLHSSEIEAQLHDGSAGLARLFESIKESLNEYLQQYLWKEGTPRQSLGSPGDIVMAKVDVTIL